MSTNTKIEWATKSWSPIIGCDRVSSGCDHCYAIRTAHRLAHNPHPAVAASAASTTARVDGRLDWTGQVNRLPDRLVDPFEWRKPQRVFVNSQSDLFHKGVNGGFIAAVFVVMAATPQHTYQILTKRPGRMRSLLNSEHFHYFMTAVARSAYYEGLLPLPGDMHWRWPLPNVWMGVSVENQWAADLRIPPLLETPAAVRWISAEPLLKPLDLLDPYLIPGMDCPCERGEQFCDTTLDWVVVGGESGPGARRMDLDWARVIQRHCSEASVPYFFKQAGTVLARELGLKGKGDDPEAWPEPWPQQYPVQ